MSFTFNVLAPLHVAEYSAGNLGIEGRKPLVYDPQNDFAAFCKELVEARRLGVDAISMDVWWGLVQPHRRGDFHWGYYERFIETVNQANAADIDGAAPLQIAPILSFHQCGGNVGDCFYIPLPQWVLPEVLGLARADLGDANVDAVDVLYLSETGSPSSEYIAHWADVWVMPLYAEFMQRFKSFCETTRTNAGPASGLIQEVNISVGPSGEIRYPSYNLHDWGEFPLWGPLQCNGNLAERAWNGPANGLPSLRNMLGEPGDGQIRSLLAFENRLQQSDPTWRALFEWYSRSLYEHAARVLSKAHAVFWDWQAPLGFKIPGVHWRANVHASNQKLNNVSSG